MTAGINDQEIPLNGILSEFRDALLAEIDVARRQESSNAEPLVNGRRIAQMGTSFQYGFSVESSLNLPGDTPADLLIPNRAPIEVSVISVDGMSVVLSVPVDVGQFVASARLRSNLTLLMRKLIERIESLNGKANSVGDRVLRVETVRGEPLEIDDLRFNSKLNFEQEGAVASSLGRNGTFIWGPPGTGKTRVIGVIGKELYERDRTALVVSHTNTAVDQAILAIVEDMEESELQQGKVLRIGEPRDLRLINDNPALRQPLDSWNLRHHAIP